MRNRGVVVLAAAALALAAACPKKGPSDRDVPRVPAPAQAADPPNPRKENPSAPRLLPETEDREARKKIEGMLLRAERLLGLLADRPLDDSQRDERKAGDAFITQAREALASADQDRAAVLADKALTLIENLEQATRP